MQIGWEQYRLDNGLRVILSPDGTHPVAAVNVWYNVGSRDEAAGRTGFAHLFEHMMFQGSANVPDTQHFAHIERAGGSANGTTWFDRTNYYETVPSHHLELALWLEGDRMARLLPAMTQAKLDNQRDVVKNERRQRVDNQPYGDWDERLQRLIFPPDHPYHHPVIGSMADLDAATLDDVALFFKTFYAPNNATLTVAGDFDSSSVRGWIDRHFGTIAPGPSRPSIPGRTSIPTSLPAKRRERVESDVALPRCYFGFRIPPFGEPGWEAVDLATQVLASGRASRLYRSLVRDRRLAQDVAAFAYPLVAGASMAVAWATAAPGLDLGAVEDALAAEIDALAATGPTEAELHRARTRLAASRVVALQRVAMRADLLSMYATLFDEPDRINRELERYAAVSAAQVREVAAEHLARDSRVVLHYLPRGAHRS